MPLICVVCPATRHVLISSVLGKTSLDKQVVIAEYVLKAERGFVNPEWPFISKVGIYMMVLSGGA